MFNEDITDIKRNWLIAIGVALGIIFLLFVIYPISIILTTVEWTNSVEKKYEYVIKILTTAGLIFGGIVGLINIFFAAKRAYAMEETAKAANENAKIARENLKISEDKQITERFAKAIEQLASDKIEVRLGAIYTLERIAKDSKKDQWTIMEVLTAFVRENAPVEKKEKLQDEKPLIHELPKLRLDIQECLTVIGRREHPDPEGKRLDLSNVNISKADLTRANFTRANLIGANLTGAYLRVANLTGAYLIGANLTGADLIGAYLIKANLIGAYLVGAYLTRAYLRGADLTGADLTGAYLTEANLTEANFIEAILTEAILTGATMPDGSIHD
jgi:hypothetical protein